MNKTNLCWKIQVKPSKIYVRKLKECLAVTKWTMITKNILYFYGIKLKTVSENIIFKLILFNANSSGENYSVLITHFA